MMANCLTSRNDSGTMFNVTTDSYREPSPRQKRPGFFCFKELSLFGRGGKRGLAWSPVMAFTTLTKRVSIGHITAVRKKTRKMNNNPDPNGSLKGSVSPMDTDEVAQLYRAPNNLEQLHNDGVLSSVGSSSIMTADAAHTWRLPMDDLRLVDVDVDSSDNGLLAETLFATPVVTTADAFRLFLLHKEAQGCRPSTMTGYRRRVGYFVAWLAAQAVSLASLTAVAVDGWGASLWQVEVLYVDSAYRRNKPGRLAVATIAGRIRAVKTFLSFCFRRGLIGADLAKELKQPRVELSTETRVMRLADLHRMLDVAQERAEAGQPRDLAVVMFMADTAARRAEVASVRIPYLWLDKGEALVWGKSGERRVDFTAGTGQVLADWLMVRPQIATDRLFLSICPRRPGPLSGESIYRLFVRLAKKAGVKGRYNPHALRHLVGKMWSSQVNLELVRQKLGHRDVTTTAAFYSHMDRSQLKAATQLHSILRGHDVV